MSHLHFMEKTLHGVILKPINVLIRVWKKSELKSVFLKLSLTLFLVAV